MTPNEAAQACMVIIRATPHKALDYDQATRDQVEREFTEIISQVTPQPYIPYDVSSRRLTEITALQGQAATCSRCGRDGTNWDHQYGCPQAQQNQSAYYKPADLCNAAQSAERFPQEIEEPRPKPWWKRLFR